MVKLFALLRRNPEISAEQFRVHWRDHHGPLIRDDPTLSRHIGRYEQHVRYRPDPISGTEGVDGVAEQWFDSIDDFVAFISEPAYRELIAPDERRFLDIDAVEFIITEEPTVVIDRSGTHAEPSVVIDRIGTLTEPSGGETGGAEGPEHKI